MQALRWVMAYLFATSSAVLASLYGFMSSVGPYSIAKPAILGLVAFFAPHGLAFGNRYQHDGRWFAAVLAYFATVVCFVVTLWGGLGTLSAGSSSVAAGRNQAAATAALDRGKLARLQDERGKLRARSEGEIRAQMLTMQALPAYRSSGGCEPAQITIDTTRTMCQGYRGLESELSLAQKITKLDADIAATEDRIKSAPPEISSDPQASAFSALTGLSVEVSAALYALCASIALELAAGVMMLMAHAPPLERASALDIPQSETLISGAVATAQQLPAIVSAAPRREEVEPRQATLPMQRLQPNGSSVYGSVRKFLETSTIAADGQRMSVKALFVRYREWCQIASMPKATTLEFFDVLDALCVERGLRIRLDGEMAYCEGLAFAA